MREVLYTDTKGFKYRVIIPDNADIGMAKFGIRIGPPPLDSLGLDIEVQRRIHNALYDRALYAAKDVRLRRMEVVSALISAYGASVEDIVALYLEGE